MLAVLSYCPKDEQQALRLALWIEELGGARGHRMLLLRDQRCTSGEVETALWRSFDGVEVLPYVDHFNAWPSSPSYCFALAARHIAATRNEPFCWLEPDVVPTRPGWLDAIADEYRSAGKPFLGDYVTVPNTDTPPHCSGIAVYPSPLVEYAGMALIAGEHAWDIIASEQIVPQMHRSELILHRWKHEPFTSWGQFEREVLAVKPRCALFHADKSFSLPPLLREHLNLSGGVESRHAGFGRPDTAKPVLERASQEPMADERAAKTVSGSSAPPAQSLSVPDRDRKPCEASTAGVETLSTVPPTIEEVMAQEITTPFEEVEDTIQQAGDCDRDPTPRYVAVVDNSSGGPLLAPQMFAPVEPWKSYDETMTEIRRHALALKPFCGKGRRTAKVREELRKAGVIR